MRVAHAGMLGASAGFLLACAICLLFNIGLTDSILRILVLTLAGGWIGILLSWLNQLLPASSEVAQEQESGR